MYSITLLHSSPFSISLFCWFNFIVLLYQLLQPNHFFYVRILVDTRDSTFSSRGKSIIKIQLEVNFFIWLPLGCRDTEHESSAFASSTIEITWITERRDEKNTEQKTYDKVKSRGGEWKMRERIKESGALRNFVFHFVSASFGFFGSVERVFYLHSWLWCCLPTNALMSPVW